MALRWPLAGYGLTTRPVADYGLAIAWLWAGYHLAIGFVWGCYGMAIGLLSAIYQIGWLWAVYVARYGLIICCLLSSPGLAMDARLWTGYLPYIGYIWASYWLTMDWL